MVPETSASETPQPVEHTAKVEGSMLDDLAFWERSFLAALPTAMVVKGWKVDGSIVSSGADRIRMAAKWADISVAQRRARIVVVADGGAGSDTSTSVDPDKQVDGD